MKPPVSLTIDAVLYRRLLAHLFPGDGDEHGAVIAAGIAETPSGTRLLARELIIARDGTDYVPGRRGYRALTARFVAETSDYCARRGLCYLAVHCHGGANSVVFSPDDLASHERGYPALLDISEGRPVGALVIAQGALAGDIWTRHGRYALEHATVVGSQIQRLYPSPPCRPLHVDPIYDRHAQLVGDVGQAILSELKVGIIGLGGGGSLLNEWLARLGVGHIVAIDFDYVDPTNLPRVVGATRWDAGLPFSLMRLAWLQNLGRHLAKRKVRVAQRVARQAQPRIRYDAVDGDILDEPTAKLLVDADFLFLCTDNIKSRLVFNALVYQYLIPGVQVGVKVRTHKETGRVIDITAATRPVLPFALGGCLHCHELIPASRLQEEGLTDRERRAQRYVDHPAVTEPSVITLNALSAAQAANDLFMMFTGLYADEVDMLHQLHSPLERDISVIEPRCDPECFDCGDADHSRRAMGDLKRLPCRTG